MIFNEFIISTNHLIRMESLLIEKMPAQKFKNYFFEKNAVFDHFNFMDIFLQKKF